MVPLMVNDVPMICINRVAVEYHIPAKLIIAVLQTENGHVGEANKNSNGTFDLGSMQINTSWLYALSHYGFTADQLQYDACRNVEAGAWILSTNIAGADSVATGVGDYHSHTPLYNATYRQEVMQKLAQINRIIGA